MLQNRVEESLNNPGTAVAVQVTGATSSSMRTFLQAFGPGADAFYFIEEGAIWEAGIGNITAGPPVLFNRNTVLDNSARNTSRLNFTGAAKIYNYIPASHAVHKAMLEAEAAARTAGLAALQTAINSVSASGSTGQAATSSQIATLTSTMNAQDAALRASINSVEQVRSNTDNALNSYIASIDAARKSDDAYYRNLQVADDNYYRNLQVNDDNALAAALRTEMVTIPGSRIFNWYGAWDSQGALVDTVWETAIFAGNIPWIGVPVSRLIGSANVQVLHPPAGAGGAGSNAQILRAYLIGPGGNQIHPNVPTGIVYAYAGQFASISFPVVFEGVEIPNGSHIRFTAERATKEGGGTVQLVTYNGSGMCVTAR